LSGLKSVVELNLYRPWVMMGAATDDLQATMSAKLCP